MLTNFLLQFTRVGAEWVLWILVLLSFACIFIMIQKFVFFRGRQLPIQELRTKLNSAFDDQDYEKAAALLADNDSMEAKCLLFAMMHHQRGAEGVEDLLAGALATEKVRYDKGLTFLATVGSNAPFIGLFGTVIGIINAFDNLAAGTEEGAAMVMAAIAEALIATGVGILVAIPAVMAYNFFKGRIKVSVSQTELLGRSLISHLRRGDGGKDGGI